MKLVKVTILSIATLFAVNNAKAQVEMSFGAKVGLNYNIISSGLDNVDASTGLGYHIGAVADFGFSEKLNFRVELLGSNRGTQAKTEIELLGIKTSTELKSSPLYLTVPILYKYNLSDKFSLMAGPQLSFLMANKYTSKTSIGSADPIEVTVDGDDAKTGMRGMEFGLAIGAEFGISENIFLGLRYVRGLQSVTDSDNAENFANVLQLSGVYKF